MAPSGVSVLARRTGGINPLLRLLRNRAFYLAVFSGVAKKKLRVAAFPLLARR